MPVPCDSSTAGRETSHTSMAVSKAIAYLRPSVLCVGGYKTFGDIYPLSFFSPN